MQVVASYIQENTRAGCALGACTSSVVQSSAQVQPAGRFPSGKDACLTVTPVTLRGLPYTSGVLRTSQYSRAAERGPVTGGPPAG